MPDNPYERIAVTAIEIPPYTPDRWYWLVGNTTSIVIDSATGEECSIDDDDYKAWLERGNKPSRIDSNDTLLEVLQVAALEAYEKLNTRLNG